MHPLEYQLATSEFFEIVLSCNNSTIYIYKGTDFGFRVYSNNVVIIGFLYDLGSKAGHFIHPHISKENLNSLFTDKYRVMLDFILLNISFIDGYICFVEKQHSEFISIEKIQNSGCPIIFPE